MIRQAFGADEGFESETDGTYTTHIGVNQIRDKFLVRVVLLLLLWPVIIVSALIVVINLPAEYHTVTIPSFFSTFLLIIPIALVVRYMAKKYHHNNAHVHKSVLIEVKDGTVYMDGKTVKIKYSYALDCFRLKMSLFKGYNVDEIDTEEFLTFLEQHKIPYC